MGERSTVWDYPKPARQLAVFSLALISLLREAFARARSAPRDDAHGVQAAAWHGRRAAVAEKRKPAKSPSPILKLHTAIAPWSSWTMAYRRCPAAPPVPVADGRSQCSR